MTIIVDRIIQKRDAMIDYASKNKQILDEWKSASKTNGDDENAFVDDGLLFRGNIYYENGIWKRNPAKNPANENELWNNSFPRIMLITKEYNDQDDSGYVDLRHETLRYNYTGKDNVRTSQLRFHTNMMYHVFGLGNYIDGQCPLWDKLTLDESRLFYESWPLVRINVKKQAGGGSVSDSTIRIYIERYKQYLNQQISLFDADIIVCYGRVVFDYVIKEFFPDIEVSKEDPWVYFSKEKQKVIINSYHPSVRSTTITDEQFYTLPINEFEQMMHDHPEFAAKYLNHRR